MLSRVKLSAKASAATAKNAENAATKLTQTKFFRFKTSASNGKVELTSSRTVEYRKNVPEKNIEKRTIGGNVIHGSEKIVSLEPGHQFFVQKRDFQMPKFRRRLMPLWDRLAQSLITISRPQPRALPELAFRSMAMFLKILTIVQVAETKAILLPGQMAMNVEGVVGEGKAEAKKKDGSDGSSNSEGESNSNKKPEEEPKKE